MAYKEKFLVAGVKMFNDTVDGKRYDNTKVFVTMDLDDSKGTAFGYATEALEFGSSQNFSAIRDMLKAAGGPVLCEIELKQTTNGKGGMKTIIQSLVPVKKAA